MSEEKDTIAFDSKRNNEWRNIEKLKHRLESKKS